MFSLFKSRPLRRFNPRPALFLFPLLFLLGLFTYWPLLDVLYLSFMRVTPRGEQFVGLSNFIGIMGHPQFQDAARNTLVYILVSIPLKVLLPLPLAFGIWAMAQRPAHFFKAVLLLPTLLSFVVVSVVWIWLLNPVMGLFQSVASLAGLQMPSLLSDADTAIHTIIGVSAWKVLGFNTLLYIAGLSAISQEYVEAMRMDGAGDGVIFRRLVLPLLSPSIFFVSLSTVLFTVQQVITPIDVMTQGGPLNATTNLFYIVYQYMFQSFNVGFAAAGTVILLVLVGLLAIVKFVLLEKRVHYS